MTDHDRGEKDVQDGWKGPRSTWSEVKKDTYDYHAWCVDQEGNLLDYPTNQLQTGFHQTEHIVRQSWDASIVAKIKPILDQRHKEWLDMHFVINKETMREQEIIENLMKSIALNTFPEGNCYHRSRLICDSNPDKYTLIIGSLGYKQADGRIYWEFG